MKSSPAPFSTLLANLAHPNDQVRELTITAIMRRRKERGQAFDSLVALLADPAGMHVAGGPLGRKRVPAA